MPQQLRVLVLAGFSSQAPTITCSFLDLMHAFNPSTRGAGAGEGENLCIVSNYEKIYKKNHSNYQELNKITDSKQFLRSIHFPNSRNQSLPRITDFQIGELRHTAADKKPGLLLLVTILSLNVIRSTIKWSQLTDQSFSKAATHQQQEGCGGTCLQSQNSRTKGRRMEQKMPAEATQQDAISIECSKHYSPSITTK